MKPAKIVSVSIFALNLLCLKHMSEQGIQTIIYCIVSEETANQTGLFYRDCREYKSQAKVGDDEAARLWELSCQLTNQ